MPIFLGIILPLMGLVLGWIIRLVYARFQLSSVEQRAVRLKQDALKDAEAKKKEVLFEAKDQLLKERNQQEREFRDRRSELQRLERRLLQKEDNLDVKISAIEKQEQELLGRERILEKKESSIEQEEKDWKDRLEKIAGLTKDEAKVLIIESMRNEAKHDARVVINKIEHEAQEVAEKKARDVLVTAIQRLSTEVSSELTVTSVSLPNDDMKGRIIGREGRNIRALETLTGVDIIIDDTPEAVVISCFDPVRKQIAKVSMERLIVDGRIHPARIEEIVRKVSEETNQTIYNEGERVLFDLGIHNVGQEGIRLLGRLYFRTSYGQNVLEHSKEVAIISGLLASEVGANREIAKRAGLFHDVGKGVEADGDSNHAEVGMELVKKMGEDDRIINAVGSHHNDIEPICLEATIVQIADAISASRPGARRETLNNYIKRLENLEKIAEDFDGVEKVYAIQAGRELRILVNNELVNDEDAKEIAKEIAKRIESELRYPGRIKITMIRETRIIEYAR